MIRKLRCEIAYRMLGLGGAILPRPERDRLLRVLRTGEPEESVPVDEVVRLTDEQKLAIATEESEREALEADNERLREEAIQAREALRTICEWAYTIHGGTKSPVDIWPELRTMLVAALGGAQ